MKNERVGGRPIGGLPLVKVIGTLLDVLISLLRERSRAVASMPLAWPVGGNRGIWPTLTEILILAVSELTTNSSTWSPTEHCGPGSGV